MRPGDLLLVTQIPGEPLGRMMEELDGTCFSHSGIAVPGPDGGLPRVASSQMAGLPGEVDWGGIRCDAFAHFWPSRDLYVIPMSAPDRARALQAVSGFEDEAGEDGRFAITKLVTIAVALHATALRRREETRELGEQMYAAAREVAETWRATPQHPRYYCAEFVAAAYGRTFARPEFDPREVDPAASEPARAGDAPTVAELLEAVRDLLLDELRPTPEQRRSRRRLVRLLAREDPAFLWRAVSTVVAAAYFRWEEEHAAGHTEPDAPPPAPAIPSPLDAGFVVDPSEWGEEIPFALVTPRMLWAAFGRGTLSRVEQIATDPGESADGRNAGGHTTTVQ